MLSTVQAVVQGIVLKGDTRHKAGGDARTRAAGTNALSQHSPSARGMTGLGAGERVEGTEDAEQGG